MGLRGETGRGKLTETQIEDGQKRAWSFAEYVRKRGGAFNENDIKKMEHALDVSGPKLNSIGLTLAVDVGHYFGAVLQSEFPMLRWYLVKEKHQGDNRPALKLMPKGQLYIQPHAIVHNCFLRQKDGNGGQGILFEAFCKQADILRCSRTL